MNTPLRYPTRIVSSLAVFASTVVSVALLTVIPAVADDGGISYGGSPHLLKGHATVSMKSEIVNVDIHKEKIKVDCTFLFHNSGKACTVRMGFPDEGEGASEPYQGDPVPTGPSLKATFDTYESYVDGKKVPTKLVPTDDRTLYWHTKTVTFKAKSDCVIRDVYTLRPGGQTTNENGLYRQTSYVLHTGASWHGPIGKADIYFKFEPDAVSQPIKIKPITSLSNKKLTELKWSKLPQGTVIYEGFGTPEVKGQTLHFSKSNFKPTKSDDIKVYYAFRMLTNM